MDGTASNLLLAVQGCTLYETSLFLLAKGIFPPQKAPGTDSLEHTVHLLLRHKNTSNVKNMKLAWSFPISVPPAPPPIAFHPEVLPATPASLSHSSRRMAVLCPLLCCPPQLKNRLSPFRERQCHPQGPQISVSHLFLLYSYMRPHSSAAPRLTSPLSPRLCSAGTAPHMLPILLALVVVPSPGTQP